MMMGCKMKRLIKNRVPSYEREHILIPEDGELLEDGLLNLSSLFEGVGGKPPNTSHTFIDLFRDVGFEAKRLPGCEYDHELLRAIVFDTCAKTKVAGQIVRTSERVDKDQSALNDAFKALCEVLSKYTITADDICNIEDRSLHPTAGDLLFASLRLHHVDAASFGKVSWIPKSISDGALWWLIWFTSMPHDEGWELKDEEAEIEDCLIKPSMPLNGSDEDISLIEIMWLCEEEGTVGDQIINLTENSLEDEY